MLGLRLFCLFSPFFFILSINLVLEWDHTTKAAITEVAAVFLLIRDNVHPRLFSKNNKKVSQGIVLSGEKRFINSRLQQVNALHSSTGVVTTSRLGAGGEKSDV